MIKIDFSDLIYNYDENLLDNLRGFGSETEFLKFWVPGTNSLKSFYNLIDALYEANNLDFTVYFNEDLFDQRSLDQLKNFLNIISCVNIKSQAKIQIEIKIDKKFYNDFKKIILLEIINKKLK